MAIKESLHLFIGEKNIALLAPVHKHKGAFPSLLFNVQHVRFVKIPFIHFLLGKNK